MNLLRRKATDAGLSEPKADAHQELTEAELCAEEIADATALNHAERTAVERHLSAALSEFADGPVVVDDRSDSALSTALPAIAEDSGTDAAHLAQELAEASVLHARWRRFLAEKGIQETQEPDRRIVAEQTLDFISRRRERLLERLEHETQEPKRHRIRDLLAELEREEDEHWEVLHPPAIGSPFGGAWAFAERFACRYRDCGREITKNEAYRTGVCRVCAEAYRLVHNESIPAL